MISSGTGKYKVWLKEEKLDKAIALIIGGGEVSHIGSIVLAEPKKSKGKISCKFRSINLPGHKEEFIAKMFAEKACKRSKVTVICTCGIHVNNATKEEIKILVDNANNLLKKY